jgi:hypothetical protein
MPCREAILCSYQLAVQGAGSARNDEYPLFEARLDVHQKSLEDVSHTVCSGKGSASYVILLCLGTLTTVTFIGMDTSV